MNNVNWQMHACLDLKRANQLSLWIVGFSTIYLFLLCMSMSIGMPMNASVLMLAELMIYLACFYVFYEKKWSVTQLAAFWFVLLNLSILFLFRSAIDLKSIRDLLIPILFVTLGLRYANYQRTDQFVFILTVVLIAIAAFEMLFPVLYGQWMPTLQFQASTGVVSTEAAMYKGQTLTLNSFRPEGIGRTWFPGLLSNQRAGSFFLEPVSFGNYAVILAAWALARPLQKRMVHYLIMVFAILILTDSRFASMLVLLLIVVRFLPLGLIRPVIFLAPFGMVLILLLIANFANYTGDNFIGRLFVAGTGLKKTAILELFGLAKFSSGYGDLGYSYVLSRFGMIFLLFAWGMLFFAKRSNAYAEYFKVMIALYMTCILAVSGTSMFALKTAGLLWFMFGVMFSDENGQSKQLATFENNTQGQSVS